MCFGDGKCLILCRNNYCLSNHEITLNYSFCKTNCENNCELIPCLNVRHCKSFFLHIIILKKYIVDNNSLI